MCDFSFIFLHRGRCLFVGMLFEFVEFSNGFVILLLCALFAGLPLILKLDRKCPEIGRFVPKIVKILQN